MFTGPEGFRMNARLGAEHLIAGSLPAVNLDYIW
jgi:hypothetical protein